MTEERRTFTDAQIARLVTAQILYYGVDSQQVRVETFAQNERKGS